MILLQKLMFELISHDYSLITNENIYVFVEH
jgi:hypothetical protein